MRILRFLREFEALHGRAPSLSQIQRGCRITRVQGLRGTLSTMARRGLIAGEPPTLATMPVEFEILYEIS